MNLPSYLPLRNPILPSVSSSTRSTLLHRSPICPESAERGQSNYRRLKIPDKFTSWRVKNRRARGRGEQNRQKREDPRKEPYVGAQTDTTQCSWLVFLSVAAQVCRRCVFRPRARHNIYRADLLPACCTCTIHSHPAPADHQSRRHCLRGGAGIHCT